MFYVKLFSNICLHFFLFYAILRTRIINIYKNTDILLYIDNLEKTTQIPGKIYDYVGTDKVILGLCESIETYDFLKKFKRIEVFYNQSNKINLEKVIKKIGTKEPLNEYSSKNLAKKFIEKVGKI